MASAVSVTCSTSGLANPRRMRSTASSQLIPSGKGSWPLVMLRAIDFFIDIIPEAKIDYCSDQKPQKNRHCSGTGCNTCHHAHNEPQQQLDL